MASSKNIPTKGTDTLDWIWTFFTKSLHPASPPIASHAFDHLISARKKSSENNLELAFYHYKKAMVLLFEADKDTPGEWVGTLHEINREYSKAFLEGH